MQISLAENQQIYIGEDTGFFLCTTPYQTLLKIDSVTFTMTHRVIAVEVFLSGHVGVLEEI